MKYSGNLFIVSVAVFGAYCAHHAFAAQNAPTAFSQYGLIQPVNKYSSNPFWNSDSPYNQRMPVPVYATGADLTSGDCNRVVESLVASYCTSHNNCSNSRLSDARPTIMVQLSQLPGHNFATSCGGYIDSAFENYKKTYGNASTGTVHYTITPMVLNTNNINIENPFKQTTTEYQSGVAERSAELARLQNATTPTPELSATYFPKTTADLSFTDRLANTTAGYEPYKDLNPYRTPTFETDSEFYARLKEQNKPEYCKRFPSDHATCDELFRHKIIYNAFGGDTKDCPKQYLTNTGITITCIPTRNNSEFMGWCTDSNLRNCAKIQTIDKSETDDKTFWAKWSCLGSAKQINNECVCTDSHMDKYCRCSGIYTADSSDKTKCVCANGENINNNCGATPPPPTNCPDQTYMDANCQCTVVPRTSINPSTGMCECDNDKDIDNNCQDTTPPMPDETYFMFWDCRGYPAHHTNLINARNSGDTGTSIRTANCTVNPGRRSTHNCIGLTSNPDEGIINRLFEQQLGKKIARNSAPLYLLSNPEDNQFDFQISNTEVDTFINQIIANKNDVKNECTSTSHAWRLFIDKHIVSGGVHTYEPYKTVCIGGMCTPGEVLNH